MVDKSAMIELSATDAGQRTPEAAPPLPLRPKGDVMRFTFATGARPLEGYTIKRGIGIGGFGQVYYAVSDAGKEVALKHIQRNLDVELRGVSQCLNLKHPNLLALYDIRYDEAGEGWVVMEYITGESLRDVLDRNPNGMPHDEISRWLAGVAAGLACLHDNGIVHRDLKPGNIFNDGGIVKIGDYGLSKFISVSRRSAQTESVGTFHYMAPEIGRGRYGREIDIYAIGIILYEMLTGDVPFDGESSQEIIMKHLTAEPRLDGLPEPYRTAISRALVKDPEKRLDNVPELLRLLNIALPAAGMAPAVALPPAVPPIRREAFDPLPEDDPVVIQDDERADDTLYIDDQPAAADDIEFGPVEHHAQPVALTAPSQIALGTTPQAAGAATAAASPPEEPVARAMFRLWQGGMDWINNPQVSTPLKVVLLVVLLGVGIPLAAINAYWIVPLVLALGVVYAVYYAVRAIVLSVQSEEEDRRRAASDEISAARRWQERARAEIAARPWPQQWTELTGSLIVSAAVAGLLSVVSMVLAGQSMGGELTVWGPQLAWFGLAAIGGAWTVLAAGKLFAGRDGDQVMRRLTMLAVGLGLGLFAWVVASGLMLNMNYGHLTVARPIPESLYDAATKQPLLPAYLAYFGGLFFILRWWLQADPLRGPRFSLWATALCAVWGLVLPFPQPWGVMLAATISIAVQLAAPWLNKPERNRIRQQFRLHDVPGARRTL